MGKMVHLLYPQGLRVGHISQRVPFYGKSRSARHPGVTDVGAGGGAKVEQMEYSVARKGRADPLYWEG